MTSSRRTPLISALFTLLAAVCLTGCPAKQPPTETAADVVRPSRQYSIEDFLDTNNYAGASFSPDNSKVLVSSDATGVWNAYSLSTSGGEPIALTDSTGSSIFALDYFPQDERFLYASDQGGNELSHVYVREIDGTVQDLTPGEKTRASFYGFSHDGNSFFVGTNERDPRFMDVYELQSGDYSKQLIFKDDVGYQIAGISPDRRYLALAKINHNADSDIYLYDRESSELRHLTPHEGDVMNVPMGFTPDGKALLYSSDEGSEFRSLKRRDLKTDEDTLLVKADWDVEYGDYSHQGRFLAVSINQDARSEIQLYDGETMEQRPLPQVPNANVSGLSFSRDETMIAFYASSSKQPGDLYVQPVGGEPKRLTRSLSDRLDAEDLVEGEVVRFKSFDGLEIPGILYQPHQASAEGAKVPALVWVHGGPGGQSRLGYSALIQYLVNHGYMIYAINNRGSSGYGKNFVSLDDRDHGKGDLGDCIAAKDMLIATGSVDPQRIGIIGGSYGGFMVLAALTFQPQAFDVGVDIFGVANWVRTTQSIPPWWEAQKKALERELGDFDDVDYLRSISPLFHADKIVKPLMVLQGANDPRVLKAESDDIVAAAKANGGPVEYIVFEDEGHGFRKKENQARGYAAILTFLDRYLAGTGDSQPGVSGQDDAAPKANDSTGSSDDSDATDDSDAADRQAA